MWDPDERALRGAQLGAEEAGRTAELLGARFELSKDLYGVMAVVSLAWASWMAVKIAAELALRAMPLERLRFDGHKGERLWFRPGDHVLQQPLYVVAGGKVVGEVAPE